MKTVRKKGKLEEKRLERLVTGELMYVCNMVVAGLDNDETKLPNLSKMLYSTNESALDAARAMVKSKGLHQIQQGTKEYKKLVVLDEGYRLWGHNHYVYFTEKEAREVNKLKRKFLPVQLDRDFYEREVEE
jgi:hypothetical protein